MKTYEQFITETNTTRAVSIAARLKGGINRLKAKIPGTQANKIQKITKRIDPKTWNESELDEYDLDSGHSIIFPGKGGRSRKKWNGEPVHVKGSHGQANRKIRKSFKKEYDFTGPKGDSTAKTKYYKDVHDIRTAGHLRRIMGEDELEEVTKKNKNPGMTVNRKVSKAAGQYLSGKNKSSSKLAFKMKDHSNRKHAAMDHYGRIKEDELDEGRAQPGKKLKSSWKSSEKGVDDEVINRKVRRAVKSTAKTGAYNDSGNTPKDPRFAKVDHYISKSNNRYNSNFHVKPGRSSNLGENEDEQLGPNAQMVQQVKKNLKLEAIKHLEHGSVSVSKSGRTITMNTVGYGGGVNRKKTFDLKTGKESSKKKTVKEMDHEDDIEYAIRSKAPAPVKPVKENELSFSSILRKKVGASGKPLGVNLKKAMPQPEPKKKTVKEDHSLKPKRDSKAMARMIKPYKPSSQSSTKRFTKEKIALIKDLKSQSR